MNKNENELIKNYLANLHVNVMLSGYNKVSRNWRDIDYLPEYNKFYFIISGEGWLRIGDREYYPQPGQLFLMPQGFKQSYSTVNENVFTKHWCHFTAKVGDINLFDILQVPYFINVEDTTELESVFIELHENLNSPDFKAPLILQSCILRLISSYLNQLTTDQLCLSSMSSMQKLNEVLNYINSNYQNDISVDDLARIAHLQPQYFIRLFRKQMGTSPIQYLNKKRMEEAKWLLGYSSLKVKEISEKVGMKEIYYFSRVFKEYTGFSPSVYRQTFNHEL